MQKLKDFLQNKAAELLLLLTAYPLTWLGGRLGAWLEQNILSGITSQEAGKLLGSILGLLFFVVSYI